MVAIAMGTAMKHPVLSHHL